MNHYKQPPKLKEYQVPITLFRKEHATITVTSLSKKDAVKLAEKIYNSEKDQCLENKEDQGYDNFFLGEPKEIIPVLDIPKNGKLKIVTGKEYTLMFLGRPYIFYRDKSLSLLKQKESPSDISRVFINAFNYEDNKLYFVELPLSVAALIDFLYPTQYKLSRTGKGIYIKYNVYKIKEDISPKNVDLYKIYRRWMENYICLWTIPGNNRLVPIGITG